MCSSIFTRSLDLLRNLKKVPSAATPNPMSFPPSLRQQHETATSKSKTEKNGKQINEISSSMSSLFETTSPSIDFKQIMKRPAK
jgi:hypothetical protein